jgi:serine/threonine protein kinase
LRWLLQVAEAIAYIHSKSVVHCDTGCHNFLVQDNGTLALCDFGGSSIDGSKMLELPKPRYARPRLRRGEKPDVKDDIFALGTALYEISTGQTLYQGKSDKEIASLFRSQAYPDLQELSPPGLGDIIRSCWLERYAVAEQVVCDLRKILLVFRRSLLRLCRLSSSPRATTLVRLDEAAVNDLSLLNLCALYFSLHPEERLATLMPRGQEPKPGAVHIDRGELALDSCRD